MFARHANPWSAWTRWASTPLVLIPVWTRRRSHAALVAGWLAVNPVLFTTPADDRAWATRAMLGEEHWILHRPRDVSMVISVVTSAVAVGALVAARRHHLRTAIIATSVQMALTLVYWELMARSFDRRQP
jgi:choline-glycine betaine transporter